MSAAAAAIDDAEDGHRDHDGQQEPGLLQESEVGAVEVESEVAGGERSDQERGQEGSDSDRRGDAETLKEVEEIVHGALAFVGGA